MFADPTYDIAFKRLFGDKGHPELTKSFLNAVLNRKDGVLIEEITFTNTEKTPRFQQEKKSYIDIQCKDQAGNEFIIEMQSAREDFFAQRAQYYVAHEVSRQLSKKGLYINLNPVIFIGVLNFNLLAPQKHSEVISHHLITNQANQQQDLKLMEFHFVELLKFKKTEKELETELDRWLYFLHEARRLDKIPKICAQSPEVKEAFEIMERAQWEEKEWLAYEEERKLQIYFATQEHVEQLRKEKLDKLEQEYKDAQRKFEVAVLERAEETALKLLRLGVSVEVVVESTGLTIEQVKSLQKK